MNYIYKNQLFKRYQGDNFRYFKTLSFPVRHRLLRHNRISEPLINFVQIFTTQNVIFCRIFANFDNLTSKEKFCRNINVGILNFICNINILFICDMSINKRLVLVLFIFYYFNSYFGCVCGIWMHVFCKCDVENLFSNEMIPHFLKMSNSKYFYINLIT